MDNADILRSVADGWVWRDYRYRSIWRSGGVDVTRELRRFDLWCLVELDDTPRITERGLRVLAHVGRRDFELPPG